MEAERVPTLPPYTIRRSDRARRSRLTVTSEGNAVVVLPARASDSVAADLVERHWRWIARHVARIVQLGAERAARPPLDSGRELLFLGAPRRLVFTTSPASRRTAVEVVGVESILVVRGGHERRPTSQILESWLGGQARAALRERVAARSAHMGIAARRLTVRDQKTRWGSASARGTLSFSWRLVMCPPWVLDYVVVHELAHLKVAGHSLRFWRLVEKHHHQSRAARKWLREHHDEIRHALD